MEGLQTSDYCFDSEQRDLRRRVKWYARPMNNTEVPQTNAVQISEVVSPTSIICNQGVIFHASFSLTRLRRHYWQGLYGTSFSQA